MTTLPFKTHYSALIIGGGQAGLSMSYCLQQKGIDHLVFERDRIGEAWRTQRWDSFCLVTPNWQCQLPGYTYPGPDPQGFMKKEEIVNYLEDYARSFSPPLHEGVSVTRLSLTSPGIYEVISSIGKFTANHVIVATGGYHIGKIPRIAERFPTHIKQVHSSDYKNSASLPAGDVLVVGTGQSGCQIAEDLHLEGRRVHLCVGGAPRTARRYRGKDVVEWLHDMGYYNKAIHDHPSKDRVRAKANHYVTGRDGGRDIDLRKFALEGMQLYGRLRDVQGPMLTFADDLRQNLDQADTTAENIKNTIDEYISAKQIDAPPEERYRPLWQPVDSPLSLDFHQANITSVVWSMGFQSNYTWIDLPIFDGKGYPAHDRGITRLNGLYFLGLPWQYTWGSGRFSGVAQDAQFLADNIAARPLSAVWQQDTLKEWALGS